MTTLYLPLHQSRLALTMCDSSSDQPSTSDTCNTSLATEISSCGCAIERLKNKSFSTLTFDEKLRVIEEGRPKPDLKIAAVTKGQKIFTRNFRVQMYATIPWLCGCNKFKKLFCWPCLLFSKEKTCWTCSGFDDLHNIHKSQNRHSLTVAHILSLKNLKMFGKSLIEFSVSDQHRISIERHNEEVRKNRKMLANLIRVICLLGKLGLSFRAHDKSRTSANRDNYIEILKYVSYYDPGLQSMLEGEGVFSELSPDIQNDLIDSVSQHLIQEIKQEVSEATFISLICDEVTDISMKSQLSSVLRYVTKEGILQERFLHFKDISQDRTADALFLHVINVLHDFDCETKLVAQTYDGAAVMAGEHRNLQSKLREQCKDAIFVHCYAHRLNQVLSQSVSYIKPVKIFFLSLSGFGTFFCKSTKRIAALDAEVKKRFPSATTIRWDCQSRLVENVQHHKADIENLFISIIENADQWDPETMSSARGHLTHLRDFDFNFFLAMFSSIFAHSDRLFQILQSKSSDVLYCNKKIQDFKNKLQENRNNFDSFWLEIVRAAPRVYSVKRNRMEPIEDEDRKSTYKRLYLEIIDVLVLNISDRFGDMDKLKFMNLLDHKQFAKFKIDFPSDALKSLMQSYGSRFDFARLRSELTAIYSDSEFCKDVSVLCEYLRSQELDDIFPETYKLSTLIWTIPATSPSTEKCLSAMKRIKNYLQNTQGHERMSSLSLLSIENRLLETLMSKERFFDSIIDIFATKTRRMELHYKKNMIPKSCSADASERRDESLLLKEGTATLMTSEVKQEPTASSIQEFADEIMEDDKQELRENMIPKSCSADASELREESLLFKEGTATLMTSEVKQEPTANSIQEFADEIMEDDKQELREAISSKSRDFEMVLLEMKMDMNAWAQEDLVQEPDTSNGAISREKSLDQNKDTVDNENEACDISELECMENGYKSEAYSENYTSRDFQEQHK